MVKVFNSSKKITLSMRSSWNRNQLCSVWLTASQRRSNKNRVVKLHFAPWQTQGLGLLKALCFDRPGWTTWCLHRAAGSIPRRTSCRRCRWPEATPENMEKMVTSSQNSAELLFYQFRILGG